MAQMLMERPSRRGIWIGGIEQLDEPSTRRALVPYTGELCGVYRLYGCDGDLLYVGITVDPIRRWRQHAATKEWWNDVDVIALVPFGAVTSARVIERQRIRNERPRQNVAHSFRRASF